MEKTAQAYLPNFDIGCFSFFYDDKGGPVRAKNICKHIGWITYLPSNKIL